MKFANLLVGNMLFRSLNILVNILITVLLTRLMSVEGYGAFSLLVANASIFSLVTCLGIESGITYHYSSQGIQKGRMFSIVYIVSFFQVFSLLVAEFVHYRLTGTYWLLDKGNKSPLLWAVIYIAGLALIDKYTALLNGAHFYTLCNKIIFISNLIAALLFCYFYFSGRPVFTFFYLEVFIAATALQSLLLIVGFHVSSGFRLVMKFPRQPDWTKVFSYSFMAFITNVIQFFAYRIDYWIIDHYQGKEEVGLYSLAVRLGQLLWVMPILFASIIFPLVADKGKSQNIGKILSLVRITNAILLAVAIVAVACASWFIPLFAGPAFRPSVMPFLYLLPGMIMFCVNIMLAAFFAGNGKLLVNLAGSVICLVLVLSLDLLLIPHYGMKGAAIASSIAYSASAIYMVWRFKRARKGEESSIFIVKKNDWVNVQEYFKGLFA